ncbi:hypothetical protein AVEN_159645-1 [Araneus ventricosus]|uniref:Uncharacterized protein n=1 Tax=Araneus ventricosus TaxID=182803 RepID=A0A4Y2RSA4_ARAVE|nr:hypothetical protein AVEN_159645-1 [Araneus ventricosus]
MSAASNRRNQSCVSSDLSSSELPIGGSKLHGTPDGALAGYYINVSLELASIHRLFLVLSPEVCFILGSFLLVDSPANFYDFYRSTSSGI